MKPKLIIVRGMSGTGKTTIAQRLAQDLAVPCLSKDHLKEFLMDSFGLGDEKWKSVLGFSATQMYFLFAGELLNKGYSVIIESPIVVGPAVDDVKRLCAQHNPDVLEILCTTQEHVRLQRMHDRIATGGRHKGHQEQDRAFISGAKNQEQSAYKGLISIGQAIEIDTTAFSEDDYQGLLAKARSFLELPGK